MPFNGSGTFQPIAPPDYPAVPDTLIRAAQFNDVIADLMYNGLTNCITRDGQSPPSANLPMANFRHTGVGAATAQGQYARIDQVQGGTVSWGGTAGGTADALTISLAIAPASLVAGMEVAFIAGNTNTGAATLAVNGLTAVDLRTSVGGALAAGHIVAGRVYSFRYDGTRFIDSEAFNREQNYTVDGTWTFNGAIVFGGSVTVNGTYDFNAAVTFDNTVDFNDSVTFAADVTFGASGLVAFDSTVDFNDVATFDSSVTFNSSVTFDSNVGFYGTGPIAQVGAYSTGFASSSRSISSDLFNLAAIGTVPSVGGPFADADALASKLDTDIIPVLNAILEILEDAINDHRTVGNDLKANVQAIATDLKAYGLFG